MATDAELLEQLNDEELWFMRPSGVSSLGPYRSLKEALVAAKAVVTKGNTPGLIYKKKEGETGDIQIEIPHEQMLRLFTLV